MLYSSFITPKEETMVVDISVIPGCLNKNVHKHREVTAIFQSALCTLQKQNGNSQMEIIVQLPNGEEIFRRVYPNKKYPNETPEHFCRRVQKEILNIV